MASPRPCRPFVALAAVLFLAAGCGQSRPSAHTAPPSEPPRQHAASDRETATASEATVAEANPICRDDQAIRESERNRASCFHLQPGVTTTKVIKPQVALKSGKTKSGKVGKTAQATPKTTAKKGPKTAAKTPPAPKTKVVQTTGLCQPQSLIYARCRTGFKTCQMGNTSPVEWFACARKNGATTSTPTVGAVIILDGNSGRNMPTGHPAYVEEAHKNQDGTWSLRISHTNYNRKCHLDLDAKVLFDPKRMTASFESGPWGPWAKNLKALGFILR